MVDLLTIFNIFATVLLLTTWPILVLIAIIGKHGLKYRLGFLPKFDSQPVWIHAASVGEAGVAVVLRDIVKDISPDTPVLITSTTKMGLRRLNNIVTEPDSAAILPLDHPLFVANAMNRVNPRMLILVETELWPNLLLQAGRRDIPIILTNGRISKNTLRWSKHIPGAFHDVTSRIDHFFMKSDYDADNLLATGVSDDKIEIAGNLKFAGFPGKAEPIEIDREPTIVFGSIRPNEFDSIIDASLLVLQSRPDALLIFAPRHLNTTSQLTTKLESAKLSYELRSVTESPAAGTNIYIIDTMGELLRLYASADIAFIGGTLADYGGHNPLEPAWFGVPVIFGKYIHANREAYDALIQSGGGVTVHDKMQLADLILELIEDSEKSEKIGNKALRAVQSMANVREKYAEAIRRYLL